MSATGFRGKWGAAMRKASVVWLLMMYGCSSEVESRQAVAPVRTVKAWSPASAVQLDAASADANLGDRPSQVAPSRAASADDEDAGPTADTAPASIPDASTADAGVAITTPPDEPNSDGSVPPDTSVLCPRAELQARAEAYFGAMALRDTGTLTLHPSVRYTENGSEMRLGRGIWLNGPEVEFVRHVLDEDRCASLSEAVLTSSRGRIVFAVRLRYLEERLLDAEAHVVPQNLTYYDPDGVIPVSSDPWIVPLASAQRSTADALAGVAAGFIEGAADPARLPQTSASCVVRQNGEVIARSCRALPPEGERFEQVRYPVADVTTGVATAIARRRGYIFMLLFKIEAGVLDDVEVVGGANSETTGW